jgi:hypothetical protein
MRPRTTVTGKLELEQSCASSRQIVKVRQRTAHGIASSALYMRSDGRVRVFQLD